MLTLEETDRVHESISIQQFYVDDEDQLEIYVKNTGGVNTRLIALWIESTATVIEPQRVTIDEYLNVEEVKPLVLDTSILNASSLTDTHTFTVITERGNYVSGEFPLEILPHISEVRYLGVFGIDWFYCKYSSQQNPPNGSELNEATFILKSEDYIAFYMNVTNSYTKPVKIHNGSFLALTTIAPAEGLGVPSFYLVQNVTYDVDLAVTKDDGITAYDFNDPYIVFPNQSQVLIFAANSAGSTEWEWGFGYPFGPETVTEGSDIQISLFYEMYDDEGLTPTGKIYGQTISTHAATLYAK